MTTTVGVTRQAKGLVGGCTCERDKEGLRGSYQAGHMQRGSEAQHEVEKGNFKNLGPGDFGPEEVT